MLDGLALNSFLHPLEFNYLNSQVLHLRCRILLHCKCLRLNSSSGRIRNLLSNNFRSRFVCLIPEVLKIPIPVSGRAVIPPFLLFHSDSRKTI